MMKILITTLLASMCFTSALLAQVNADCDASVLMHFDFTNDVFDVNEVGMSGLWTNAGGFEWTNTGTAAAFPAEWGTREPILSVTGGGAIVIGGRNFGEPISPVMDFSSQAAGAPVYLQFNQYYRQGDGGLVGVVIQDEVTAARTFYDVNDFVQDGVETGRRDQVLLDVTAAVSSNPVRLIFTYEGSGSFWIIDDVYFFEGRPCPPTRPASYGPDFTDLGYDYAVDDAGWPYAPNEIVIQFSPDASPADKQALRDTLGAVLIDSCVCNKLELWRLGDSVLVDGDGNPYPGHGSIGIQERVQGASAQNKVQGVDFNYYTVAQFRDSIPLANSPLSANDTTSILQIGQPDDIRIAILDTGVDFTDNVIRPFIRRKPSNCYENDPIGRNFVYDNNNPQDDHSHGTHVAGIIARALTAANLPNCNFHIIPYKTHDSQGVSSLFDVTCATYQALADKASVINDSWGFYGDGSIILSNAVDSAEFQGVLLVSSAGNDSLSLDTLLQYPACYPTANRLTVAAYQLRDGPGGVVPSIADFSNRSSSWVNIAAPGVDIISSVPDWYQPNNFIRMYKSGTSMAAPAVTAAAAISFCEKPGHYAYPRERILNCADTDSNLGMMVDANRILNPNVPCLTPIEEVLESAVSFSVYPNPTRNSFTLQITTPLQQPVLRLYRADGQLLRTQTLESTNPSADIWINMSDFPSGMYWVELRDGQARWIEKLVIIE